MKATPIARFWTNTGRFSFACRPGERADDQDMQRLNQLGVLLQFNPETSAYLLAEFRFQRMLSDIFKILGSVAGIDLDMLTQG